MIRVRLLSRLERQFLRSIMFYVVHSFRARGMWPSIRLWAGEISFCYRANDPFLLSRPFMDQPEATLGEGNNPFQAAYFSVAKEALSIVRDQEGAVSLCDVGAGNGRVVKIALDLGFQDVWGIEIDGRWEETLRALREEVGGRFQFVIGDALTSIPQKHFGVIFLFNPISRESFSKFLDILKKHELLPRVFVQINPQYDDMIEDAGYQETHSLSTGEYVEYKIFSLRAP